MAFGDLAKRFVAEREQRAATSSTTDRAATVARARDTREDKTMATPSTPCVNEPHAQAYGQALQQQLKQLDAQLRLCTLSLEARLLELAATGVEEDLAVRVERANIAELTRKRDRAYDLAYNEPERLRVRQE